MRKMRLVLAGVMQFAMLTATSDAKVNTVVVRNNNDATTPSFKLKVISPPAKDDAATKAKFSVVDGRQDPNGGDTGILHDGSVPTDEDNPADNFFFDAGTAGGRLVVDFGKPIAVDQVNTYSWHPTTRGPQVYKLYGSSGTGDGFEGEPKSGTDPAKVGWKLITTVDTRDDDDDEVGGQYGVSIFDSDGAIGTYRYLLFDASRTEDDDTFGNTFYSEIDVVSSDTASAIAAVDTPETDQRLVLVIDDGDGGTYEATIVTEEAPGLTKWANEVLAPVVKEWYPKIVKLLPSEDYNAPRSFSIVFTPSYEGVAATGGTRVVCNPAWIQRELDREAKGAVVHELVHVVQQYGRARRNNRNATRSPGWLVEGVADYIRWFLYEPESRGAEITERNINRANYDGSYRVTANFLNWVTEKYDKKIVEALNAAMREGRYNEDLWSKATNRTLAELGDEWKATMARRIAGEEDPKPAATEEDAAEDAVKTSSSQSQINSLTDEEKAAGWVLLFDGEGLDGWHTFRSDDVRPGWQVKDGVLMCVDPRNAGDLCTDKQFDWFELKLEYNISEGGNSGIMFHVTDEERFAWATGPEFQLEDNEKAPDPTRCGWLYALYQPPTDPDTGKPLDSTKPAGQWNEIRLVISPQNCTHEINGVKYFDYVLGSEDFAKRVADSKFGRMRRFAKSDKGYIALQGDHGQISFRNVKIRPIVAKDGEQVSVDAGE